MTADLHLHTHYSDGNWTPQDLVDAAVRLGFKSIAITDHDTVAGLAEARQHAQGRIRIIDGIEFNTVWINPAGEREDVHILGYFIDPANKDLEETISAQQKARLNYVDETLQRLRSQGYRLDLEQVLACAGKGSIGRPHICAAMLKAGVTGDIQAAYRMLMNRDSELRVLRRSISPPEAIAAIRAAGGISSLAHPGKDEHLPELLNELKKNGLSALEAYHRGHTPSMVRKFLKLSRIMDLLVSGGSDCHGPFEEYPASLGTIRLAPDLLRKLEDACHKMRDSRAEAAANLSQL